jgi:hypothetical protein
MKKFLLVLLIVLFAIEMLAACAPITGAAVEEYAMALPGWVIILCAVVLFLIGFGIIWKLIPGFIKFIALVALAIILAGTAYGVWHFALVDKALDEIEEIRESYEAHSGESPSAGESGDAGIDIDIHIGD